MACYLSPHTQSSRRESCVLEGPVGFDSSPSVCGGSEVPALAARSMNGQSGPSLSLQAVISRPESQNVSPLRHRQTLRQYGTISL